MTGYIFQRKWPKLPFSGLKGLTCNSFNLEAQDFKAKTQRFSNAHHKRFENLATGLKKNSMPCSAWLNW